MRIENGMVFCADDVLRAGSVIIRDGVFSEVPGQEVSGKNVCVQELPGREIQEQGVREQKILGQQKYGSNNGRTALSGVEKKLEADKKPEAENNPGAEKNPEMEKRQGVEVNSAGKMPPDCEEVLDASGCYVIPGLVDIHFHGCMGEDFCDGTPQALHTIASYEAGEGVTTICPATLTLPVEELKQVLSNAAAYAAEGSNPHEADLAGINMEGPFISQAKKGAQNGNYIIPCDPDICREFVEASSGLVRIVGLAPEENPDFVSYINAVKDTVKISLAHTNAGYDTAKRAFDAGASHVVHLFNAMPEMLHREPGVVGAARDASSVTAELICDGNHVHPALVRAAFDMFGKERIVLISDSLRATGLGDGRIMLGGQEVEVHGTRATLVDGGNLAGSVVSLMQCVQIVVKQMDIPLEWAVRCASINPARVIGADKEYGSIEAGKHGNVVLLDKEDLSVQAVIKDGVRIR